jgi:S1-C subfamily serine protease
LIFIFANIINTNYVVGHQTSENILQQYKTTDLTIHDLFSQTSKSVVQITVIDPLSNAQQGLGSGFLYDKEGHLITNNDLVAFNQDNSNNSNFLVTFSNGNSYQAELVGNDPYSNVAVLKLLDPMQDIDINPIPLGNSSSLRVGDTVVAIGNPFGLSGALTEGVVTGLGRLLPSSSPSSPPENNFENGDNRTESFSIPDIIQHDAALNPGNGGGPLLNLKGEVIGMNAAIFSNTGVYAGVGFAIPSNTLKKAIPELIEKSFHSFDEFDSF